MWRKILLVLLQTVPALFNTYHTYKRERELEQRNKEIDADPLGEFANRFGQLRDDTYSDPAARCLCDTTIDCDPTNSPCMAGRDISAKRGCSEVNETP